MTRGGRPPKLTPAQARDLRRARLSGTGYDQLAAFWGISRSTARRYAADLCRQHKERRA